MELSVADLACRRAGRMVFRGLSFALAGGEAAVLVGPNGAGKSSLLRVLAGLTPPAGGRATLDGRDLARDRDATQTLIAWAGHLDAVKPAFTVRRNLELWADMLGAPRGRVGPALDRFGLAAIADDPAHLCSAGQKRRLGLARLPLMSDRPLWLLDEPTVSLDADSAATFAALVRAHCAGGGVALIATHVDLGLDAPRRIDMGALAAAATPEAARADDPFLAGDWAEDWA